MSQPITPWANTPNYPAGGNPWNGQPTKVAPAYTYFTPNVPPAAQEMNYILNQRDAILTGVALGQWSAAVANWNPPSADIGGMTLQNTPTSAWWDAFSGQWMVPCIVSGGTAQVLMCSADGKVWRSINGGIPSAPARFPFAVATNGSTGDICLFRSDGTTSSITRWAGGAGVPVDTVQPFLAGIDQGVMTFWNGGFIFVGASGLGSAPWTGAAGASPNGVGVWNNTTVSLPAGWSSGTQIVLEWLTAQNATTLVVAQCGDVVGTAASRLMVQTTASPGVWSDVTPSFLGGTAKEIRGLAYSSNDGLWGVLAIDNSNAYLYTSPDLATWTLVQTFTGYTAAGVAAIGSAWAVVVYNGNLGTAGNRILYSINVASAGAQSTWQFGAYEEDFGGSGSSLNLIQNPAGLLLSNGAQILRCEILRDEFALTPAQGGIVASSLIAGFAGNVPVTPILSTAPVVIRITFANSPVGTPMKPTFYGPATVMADASGGALGFDLGGAAVPDGTVVSIVNINGGFATHNCTLSDSSGRTIESPSAPLTFNATQVLNVSGAAYDYMLDVTNNRWKLV